MRILLIFWLIFLSTNVHGIPGQPITTSAGTAKTFLPLNIQNTCQIITGSISPASSAVSAPKCSMYMSTNGLVYIKQDAGSSTNWTALGAAVTTYAAPTVQVLTSGTTYNKDYTFVISSGNATVGATYTNNAVTFTVYATVASATQVVMSGSGAPTSSGTLTKSGGTGDATLTFTQVLAPLYLHVRGVGGGGGGAGAATTVAGGGGAGGTGGTTTFGTSLLSAAGGVGGTSGGAPAPGLGGTASVTAPAHGIGTIGSTGGGVGVAANVNFPSGGQGGNSPFGGAGGGGPGQTGGTGSNGSGGGGGGATTSASSFGGAGGGAGGYFDAIVPSPSATYTYAIGGAGTLGALASGGAQGGAGGAGLIIVEEYYQ